MTDYSLYLICALFFATTVFFISYCVNLKSKLHNATVRADTAITKLNNQLENNRALLRAAGDGIHVIDTDGNIVIANEAFAQMLGYSMTEAMQLNVTQWDVRWSKEELIANIPELRGRITTFETRHKRKDGEVIDVEVNTVGVDINDVPLLFCSARDITRRKRSEASLLQAASVFHHAQESIVITDPDGRVSDVNEAFTRVTGYSRDEVLGNYPPVLNAEKNGSGTVNRIWEELRQSGYWSGESWNRHRNGSLYAVHLTVSKVPDKAGGTHGLVVIFTDISALKEQQLLLEKMAHHDPLTQLPNRILLFDRLQLAITQAVRRNNLVAVIYLDLDGFKLVNDTCGHDTGDALLVDVSRNLQAALRDGDSIARIGGDEFVAVLADLDSVNTCERILRRLLESASVSVEFNENTHQLSVSMGVAMYPQHGDSADNLVRLADQAMYQAKRAGKNRYHFSAPGAG